jgi:hypothetical protein
VSATLRADDVLYNFQLQNPLKDFGFTVRRRVSTVQEEHV